MTEPAERRFQNTFSQGGLYLHVPFCASLCRYCDFPRILYSHELEQRYIKLLEREMDAVLPEGYSVTTFYSGGGTPSTLSAESWRRIFEALRRRCNFAALKEATCEANPESFSEQVAAAWLEFGIDRVSFGVQSFDKGDLETLGRIHDLQRALDVIRNAGILGFSRVSADLIYGLPGRDLDAWLKNLARLAALPITHFSAYSLTVEPGTEFHRLRETGRLNLPTDKTVAEIYRTTMKWAVENGFRQYEISNYYRRADGGPCLHNLAYWRRRPVLALGPGASGFDGYRRWTNYRDFDRWAGALEAGELPVEYEERLEGADAAREEFIIAMRLNDGLEIQMFLDKLEDIEPAVARDYREKIIKFVKMEMMRMEDTRLALTDNGRPVADEILSEFV